MKRVALIEPVGGHGGMDYYDFGLIINLVKNGCYVKLYTSDNDLSFDGAAGVDVEKCFIGVYGKSNKLLRLVRFFRGLFRACVDASNNKLKNAHFQFFGVSGLELATVIFSRFFFSNIVVTIHDVESFANKQSLLLDKVFYRIVDKVVVHNRVCRNEILERVPEVLNRLSVIPHGNYLDSDFSSIPRELAVAELGGDPSKKMVLFFGQIKKVKGLDVLIHAVSHLKSRRDDFSIVVAGKVWKDDFSIYQDLIDKLDVSDFFKLDIRYIPDEELAVFYSAAYCIVLPYKKIYQSGVLLMAMSFGVPVIVSSLPGMLEVVDDGKNGFVFESGNALSLADKIDYALSNTAVVDEVKGSALNLMRLNYSWEVVAKDTAVLYVS
ncbi:glycosyltransferase involved in cell wall biosynthesis [Azonexus fungiphilus]|uniref:Glycosyltransferase involved in cell wall biosynthesis n=1 Tax=Azonexus fungiphilus TaxID=146940 RepID=A0A495WFF9_9RHOO|nr:glycosyltransferase family 4 protein [Azonexus fungiphilus]RKT60442.1 glycosyltransferase involved in cell wall biosynthesis [Azonexus fungiphilus]